MDTALPQTTSGALVIYRKLLNSASVVPRTRRYLTKVTRCPRVILMFISVTRCTEDHRCILIVEQLCGGPHRRIIVRRVARRPPAKPCFEPGRQLTQHPRLTHHTPAPSPCSHLARHPPHRVLRLCTSPPLLRSSTSPPQHCTPRQAYACASTQAYSQRAASLCAFF